MKEGRLFLPDIIVGLPLRIKNCLSYHKIVLSE